MPDHCTQPARSPFTNARMAEERRSFDGYQEFVEPRQLTLDCRELGDAQSNPRDSLSRQDPSTETSIIQDPLARPYASLESTNYQSPSRMTDTLDFTIRGGSRSPFLWSGDYGPNLFDTCPEFPPLPFDDWGSRLDERHDLGYETPTLPSLSFSTPFPGVNEMLGHHPSLQQPGPTLPPLHSFAPLSPFSYETNSMNMFHPNSRALHASHPELDGGNQLPLLPVLGNHLHDYGEHRTLQGPPPAAGMTSKKARVDKRNTKPLAVEDLLHDNSRFAKVVKAFLSIEDQENRTVPEIAKRVSEMYVGQYADFEGVKRMVNDVLQKHKAFWHPGRGSPYQLNLNEGRARREFPSNSRRLVRNRYDENVFYTRNKKQRKARQTVKKSQEPVIEDSSDISVFPNILLREDQEHGKIQLGINDESEDNYHEDAEDLSSPTSIQAPRLFT